MQPEQGAGRRVRPRPCWPSWEPAAPTLVVVEDVHWAVLSRDLLTPAPHPRVPLQGVASCHLPPGRPPTVATPTTLAVWPGSPMSDHPEPGSRSPSVTSSSLSPPCQHRLDEEATADIVRAEVQPFAEEFASSAVSPRRDWRTACVPGGSDRAPGRDGSSGSSALAVAERDVSQRHARAEVVDPPSPVSRRRGVRRRGTPRRGRPAGPGLQVAACAASGEVVPDQPLPGERLRLHRRYAAVFPEHPRLAPASEPGPACAGERRPDSGRCEPRSRRTGQGRSAARRMPGAPERALDLLSENDPSRDEVTLRASDAVAAAIRCSPCGSWPTG